MKDSLCTKYIKTEQSWIEVREISQKTKKQEIDKAKNKES